MTWHEMGIGFAQKMAFFNADLCLYNVPRSQMLFFVTFQSFNQGDNKG